MHRWILTLVALAASPALADNLLDELVVTSHRSPLPLGDHVGNIAVVDTEQINAAAAVHIHELMTRVAGVWISRGSGQESLPSVRSPVLTGAGSCGAFLTLEDGIPSRPSGFCNVNQLFELPTELAQSIEVIRGPGNALYGSNGLHGTLNVITPRPDAGQRSVAVEFGPNDYYRAQGVIGTSGPAPWQLGGVFAHDGGFRDDSGYQQGKFTARKAWTRDADQLSFALSLSDLDQQTAGFIFGEDAYKDESLSEQNLNPEAYRLADSQRLSFTWLRDQADVTSDVRVYLRRSDMEFLQHFLPGQPVEENGHLSLGVLSQWRMETETGTLTLGADLDYADVFLKETQFGPTVGSAFLVETRPEGKHYDYDVNSLTIGAYAQWDWQWRPSTQLSAGARIETADYDYRNNMISGNTRDDGTPCGFGGCLYTRPDDRSDRFTNVAPNLGLRHQSSESTSWYANVSRGFRAPQMTELYRLQNGQQVSDLDAETIDALELGWRFSSERYVLDTAVFAMQKRNSVYRDADGFNVSNGESQHVGIEFLADVALSEFWQLRVNGTYAEHTYDFNTVAARGETFESGNLVDTAPRWQGSADLVFAPDGPWQAEVQWVSLGSYYLDAENLRQYEGHDIGNLRLGYTLKSGWTLSAWVKNLTDRRYADRADFAFGNYRYFPGRSREVYVRLQGPL